MNTALMNLVTALLLNACIETAAQDKEAQKAWEKERKKKQIVKLRVMFVELDDDGSGAVTLDEIQEAPADVQEELTAIAGTDDIQALFEMLDYDGGGSIDTDEFCDGVMRAASTDKPMEYDRLVKQCTVILHAHRQVVDSFHGAPVDEGSDVLTGGVVSRMDSLESTMAKTHADLKQLLAAVSKNR